MCITITHANYGWGLLEKGNHKKALVHFRESLKSDPNFSYAQSGMAEAIKASNFVYRIFLKYTFWIGNLTAKYQWAVIIGFYIGFRLLRALAAGSAALKPFLTPVIIIFAIIAFSTWIVGPIANLFLRFNSYGQLLLDKKEKMSSNFVAASLGIFVTGLVLYFILKDERFLAVVVFGFATMPLFSMMLSPSGHKYALLAYAVIMTLIGLIAIMRAFATGNPFNPVTIMFIVGFVGFQWVANYLIIKENNT